MNADEQATLGRVYDSSLSVVQDFEDMDPVPMFVEDAKRLAFHVAVGGGLAAIGAYLPSLLTIFPFPSRFFSLCCWLARCKSVFSFSHSRAAHHSIVSPFSSCVSPGCNQSGSVTIIDIRDEGGKQVVNVMDLEEPVETTPIDDTESPLCGLVVDQTGLTVAGGTIDRWDGIREAETPFYPELEVGNKESILDAMKDTAAPAGEEGKGKEKEKEKEAETEKESEKEKEKSDSLEVVKSEKLTAAFGGAATATTGAPTKPIFGGMSAFGSTPTSAGIPTKPLFGGSSTFGESPSRGEGKPSADTPSSSSAYPPMSKAAPKNPFAPSTAKPKATATPSSSSSSAYPPMSKAAPKNPFMASVPTPAISASAKVSKAVAANQKKVSR